MTDYLRLKSTNSVLFFPGIKTGGTTVDEFMIQFLICNILISAIIGILLPVKHLLRKSLTSRMQYHIWYLLLGLLTVPFISGRSVRFLQIFTWFGNFKNASSSPIGAVVSEAATANLSVAANWMNDIGISVSRNTPSTIGLILFILWSIGILIMIMLIIKSLLRFHNMKHSALPLQNPAVRKLYYECIDRMCIKKPVPVYSTAFLRSPVISGLWKPCIYMPIHLISDYRENDIKYMLMHELAHYRHKDALANYFMNIIGVVYWFNPFV